MGLVLCSLHQILYELDKTALTKLIGENWEHGDYAKKGLIRQETQEVRQSDNLEKKPFGFVKLFIVVKNLTKPFVVSIHHSVSNFNLKWFRSTV